MKLFNLKKYILKSKNKVILGIFFLPIGLGVSETLRSSTNTQNLSRTSSKTNFNNKVLSLNKGLKTNLYTTNYYCPGHNWKVEGKLIYCEDDTTDPEEENIKKAEARSKKLQEEVEDYNKRVEQTKAVIELLRKIWESEKPINWEKEWSETTKGTV